MNPEELRKLVSQPESEVLEFKVSLPDTKFLATIISAFANTIGGRLIIGIRGDGRITGINDIDHALLQIEQALRIVSPTIKVETEIVSVGGKSVLVATIPKGSQPPYLAAGRAFLRVSTQIMPITAQALYTDITKRAKSLDDLQTGVKQLSMTIETMNHELIVARNWKTKLIDMIIGGIIGALISLLISLSFGL
jgi:predicted HTH transcriptional regulator